MRTLLHAWAFAVFAVLPLINAQADEVSSVARFQKLKSVLEHLHAWDDHSYYDDLKLWDGTQTRKGFETILKFVDPHHLLNHYASWDDEKLTVYFDRDTKQIPDYSIRFKTDGNPGDPQRLIHAIREAARTAPSAQPLLGLRVALDPGHMGGQTWDHMTGKYVDMRGTSIGGYVSEGTMNLHVCLLLAAALVKLGAEVKVTHLEEGPVSPTPLETYDMAPMISRKIQQNADEPWFDALIESGKPDSSPELNMVRNPGNRTGYFILGEDLLARAKVVADFHPHLVLVVHFDASNARALQTRVEEVRGYVAGNVLPQMGLIPGECSSREQVFSTVRTLIAGQRWMQSLEFAAYVTSGISKATGVKLMTDTIDYQAIRVEDGVYARNLALNRMIIDGVMAYLEVLNYDYQNEFKLLAKQDKYVDVGLENKRIRFNYSPRLDDIVDGMKRGILDYVRSQQ